MSTHDKRFSISADGADRIALGIDYGAEDGFTYLRLRDGEQIVRCPPCAAGVPRIKIGAHVEFFNGTPRQIACRHQNPRTPACPVCMAIGLTRNGTYGTRRRSPITALWALLGRRS